jgi:hypothetical protein
MIPAAAAYYGTPAGYEDLSLFGKIFLLLAGEKTRRNLGHPALGEKFGT